MGAALEIMRADYTSAELRALGGRCSEGAQVRRLLALALVLEGHSRTEAAKLSGMDRQTLRDWAHRYNAEGGAGLKSRRSPGRAPALSERQMAELRELVIQAPIRRSTFPELNPMENVWDYLRQNKLCAQVWDTCDDILDACQSAWRFLINDPDRIRSIGHRKWAWVSL